MLDRVVILIIMHNHHKNKKVTALITHNNKLSNNPNQKQTPISLKHSKYNKVILPNSFPPQDKEL